MSLSDDLEVLHSSVNNERVNQELLDAIDVMADNIRMDNHEATIGTETNQCNYHRNQLRAEQLNKLKGLFK